MEKKEMLTGFHWKLLKDKVKDIPLFNEAKHHEDISFRIVVLANPANSVCDGDICNAESDADRRLCLFL
jgi:hypothetical protein